MYKEVTSGRGTSRRKLSWMVMLAGAIWLLVERNREKIERLPQIDHQEETPENPPKET